MKNQNSTVASVASEKLKPKKMSSKKTSGCIILIGSLDPTHVNRVSMIIGVFDLLSLQSSTLSIFVEVKLISF